MVHQYLINRHNNQNKVILQYLLYQHLLQR